MGVDVTDVACRQAGVLQCKLHRALLACRIRARVVAGIAGVAVPAQFGMDVGAATTGNAFPLENEGGRPFPKDEAVAPAVEGEDGVGAGETHRVEAAAGHAVQLVGASGDHDVAAAGEMLCPYCGTRYVYKGAAPRGH